MNLFVRFGANITEFLQKMQDVQGKMRETGDLLQKVGGSLSLTVSAPLALAGGAALKMAADMEQAAISFEVLTKSAEGGQKVMQDLQKFAADTPFEFPELAAGAKGLLAYGFQIEHIIPLMRTAGNLASGMGVNIEEVTRVLGRLKAGDFGEAFERLRDFGISKTDLEGEGLKFDKSGSYQGSVAKALEAVDKIIQNKFGGMTERQAQSLGGLWSTLTDNIGQTLAGLGTKFVELFNVKDLLKQFTGLIERLQASFNSLSPIAQKAIFIIGGLLIVIPPIMVAIGGLISAFGAITAPLLAISAPIAAVVAAFAGAVTLIVVYWDEIKTYLTNSGIWDSLKSLAQSAMDFLVSAWNVIKVTGIAAWKTLKAVLGPLVSNLWTTITVIFKTAINALSGLLDFFTGLFTLDFEKMGQGLKKIFGSIWNGIIDLSAKGLTKLNSLIADGLEAIGMDDMAKKFRDANANISRWAGQVTVEFNKVVPAAKKTAAELAKVTEGKVDFSGYKGGKGDEAEAEKRAKAEAKFLQDQIADLEKVQKIRRDLTVQSIGEENLRKAHEIYLKGLEREKEIRDLNISDLNKELAIKQSQEATQREINDLIEKQMIRPRQIQGGFGGNILGPDLSKRAEALNALVNRTVAAIQPAIVRSKEFVNTQREYFQSLGPWGQLAVSVYESLGRSIYEVSDLQKAGLTSLAELGNGIVGGLQQGFQSLLETGKFSFKGIAQALTGMIAKLAAAAAVAFVLNAALGGAGLSIGGTALGGGKGFAKLFTSFLGGGFKTGGIADGPSSGYLALLHGREVITPYNQAEKMLSGGGGNQSSTPQVINLVVDGQKLASVVTRANNNNNRIG